MYFCLFLFDQQKFLEEFLSKFLESSKDINVRNTLITRCRIAQWLASYITQTWKTVVMYYLVVNLIILKF